MVVTNPSYNQQEWSTLKEKYRISGSSSIITTNSSNSRRSSCSRSLSTAQSLDSSFTHLVFSNYINEQGQSSNNSKGNGNIVTVAASVATSTTSTNQFQQNQPIDIYGNEFKGYYRKDGSSSSSSRDSSVPQVQLVHKVQFVRQTSRQNHQ
ncbi:hypothetical protein ACTA71_008770 [Dictyostelium dimigraforme]